MTKQNVIRNNIITTIRYFHFFNYAPSEAQIHFFLSIVCARREVTKELKKLVIQKKVILVDSEGLNHYTLPTHGISRNTIKTRKKHSLSKISCITIFVRVLSFFPQIALIGVSGSVSMSNAREGDDIDIFIISSRGRVWTARIIAHAIAQILRVRRGRGANEIRDKVCLNLFFDGRDLAVPDNKRNRFVAHEVFQMNPLMVRGNTYADFISANLWANSFLPNARSCLLEKKYVVKTFPQRRLLDFKLLGDSVEMVCRAVQIRIIRQHRTTEYITDTQLWFFPNDMEAQLRKAGVIV